MAMNPNPDRNIQFMKENWGTVRLITDYVPQRRKNEPPSDRYSRHCGGKNGFDDYVERWHE
jgi:hypothetical protein